jgi:hypothetical protein
VNLNKMVRFLVMCVAVTAVSAGCAVAQGPTVIQTPEPLVTTEAPAPEPSATQEPTTEPEPPVETPAPQAPEANDELATWTDGTVSPDYQWLADIAGLESIMKPHPVYTQSGIIGVAVVGLRCLAVIDQNADDPGNYTFVLHSRSGTDIIHDGNNLSPEEVKLMLDNFSFVCSPLA